ncbi:MAG: GNAT family N-acetyltransferase [Chitinophagales bacterium]|nr:GNAT family N-acetyltransferase [Chitinophagales bacterium]
MKNSRIRRAQSEDAKLIAPILILAMEEIVFRFIGVESKEKAILFLERMIAQPANQYSYENIWLIEKDGKFAGAACVYDGALLEKLRQPVIDTIYSHFGRLFNYEDETQAGEIYIDSVSVSPDMQGKGIGSELFSFLIHHHVKSKNETLGLLVEEENSNALKLYLKLGFQPKGEKTLVGKKMIHLQIEAMK